MRGAEDFLAAGWLCRNGLIVTDNRVFTRAVRKKQVAIACCCDECCGLVEKQGKGSPSLLFSGWCPVDSWADPRKSGVKRYHEAILFEPVHSLSARYPPVLHTFFTGKTGDYLNGKASNPMFLVEISIIIQIYRKIIRSSRFE